MGQHSVLIIGAGRIGAFIDAPQSVLVQSHAHAFSSHPGFSLAGFVDADHSQAAKAAAVWGGEAFSSIAEAFTSRTIDAAVIASPDETHYELLKILSSYPLRLVFSEKPMTGTVAEGEEIVALYHEAAISLAVNFSRRFVPEVQALRAQINAGSFGKLLGGTGWYGKGTLHNGSHLIDLIHYLLGAIDDALPVASVIDWRESDPTCSAVLMLHNGACFFMHGVDCRALTIFEMDIVFERQRVRIVDSGVAIEMYAVKDNPLYPGFRDLRLTSTIETSHGNAARFAADHLYAHLENNAPLCSTGEDGLAAQSICAGIIERNHLIKETDPHAD